jgi:hypothetical protein
MLKFFRKIIPDPCRHSAWLNYILLSVLLLQSSQPLLFAQTQPEEDRADYNELYKFVLDKYGIDQILANGVLYTEMYLRKEGHQFLDEDRLYTGNLVLRGKEYVGLEMKYDICNQQLIVFIKTNSIHQGIIPPHDFISAFSLEGKYFHKEDFRGEPEFYQVVFDTDKLKCLYHWSKQTMETAGNENYKYFHYEFTASKKRSFLYINGSFEPYKKNRSFIDLFPEDIRNRIGHFMKANTIKVTRCSDEQMVDLMTYCYTLLK